MRQPHASHTSPRDPVDRRGSSYNAGCFKKQLRRTILRLFRGDARVLPDSRLHFGRDPILRCTSTAVEGPITESCPRASRARASQAALSTSPTRCPASQWLSRSCQAAAESRPQQSPDLLPSLLPRFRIRCSQQLHCQLQQAQLPKFLRPRRTLPP